MHTTDHPVLAYSIKGACAATSLSRSRIYELLRDKKLESRKIGKRTVIPASSLHRLLEAA